MLTLIKLEWPHDSAETVTERIDVLDYAKALYMHGHPIRMTIGLFNGLMPIRLFGRWDWTAPPCEACNGTGCKYYTNLYSHLTKRRIFCCLMCLGEGIRNP